MLIARENGFLRNALGALAVIVVVPLAILAKIISMPFERPAKRTPAQVAAIIRGFIHGTGNDNDWDWFVSVPLADAQLESIRLEAAKLELPADSAGLAALAGLLRRVEILEAERG